MDSADETVRQFENEIERVPALARELEAARLAAGISYEELARQLRIERLRTLRKKYPDFAAEFADELGSESASLADIFDGWNGHQTSLVHAIAPLTREQLIWRPTPGLSSVGELARHISLGRLTWFRRMDAPGSAELANQIDAWEKDSDGNFHIVEGAVPIAEQADQLVHWLEITWQMIGATLASWNVADLTKTYRHTWNGDTYAVSRQWTIWRILSHDIHHGGQVSLLLGMQGIKAFELGDWFGHITLPPLADGL